MELNEWTKGLEVLQAIHGNFPDPIIDILHDKWGEKDPALWLMMCNYLVENGRYKPKPVDFGNAYFKVVEEWQKEVKRTGDHCWRCNGKGWVEQFYWDKLEDRPIHSNDPCRECNQQGSSRKMNPDEFEPVSLSEICLRRGIERCKDESLSQDVRDFLDTQRVMFRKVKGGLWESYDDRFMAMVSDWFKNDEFHACVDPEMVLKMAWELNKRGELQSTGKGLSGMFK